MHKIKIY